MRSLELSSPAASHNRCDLGAQYISQGVSGSGFCDDLYEYLKNRGTLKVMGDNNLINGMRPEHQLGKHFIAPAGTSSIVSTLLEGANVITGKKLLKLSLNVQSFTFVAQTAVDGAEEFDAVITTMMAPQLKVLFNATPKHVKTEREERIDEMVDLSVPADVLAGLDKVAYSSRCDGLM